MKILGIDYGRKKIGLALAEGFLAYPFKVIRVKSESEAVKKLSEVLKVYAIEKVVIGVSEGEMGKETKDFGKKIGQLLKALVIFQDETLSTYEAQQRSKEAGMKRKKRKSQEDAYAATVMLQNYLDSVQ